MLLSLFFVTQEWDNKLLWYFICLDPPVLSSSSICKQKKKKNGPPPHWGTPEPEGIPVYDFLMSHLQGHSSCGLPADIGLDVRKRERKLFSDKNSGEWEYPDHVCKRSWLDLMVQVNVWWWHRALLGNLYPQSPCSALCKPL